MTIQIHCNSTPSYLCTIDIDECSGIIDPCDDDNSVCINTFGDFRCECAPGYLLQNETCEG